MAAASARIATGEINMTPSQLILSPEEKSIQEELGKIIKTLQEIKSSIAEIKKDHFAAHVEDPSAPDSIRHADSQEAFGFVSRRIYGFILAEPKDTFREKLSPRYEPFQEQICAALQDPELRKACLKIRATLTKIKEILFHENRTEKFAGAGQMFVNLCAYIQAFLFDPPCQDSLETLGKRLAESPAKKQDLEKIQALFSLD
jgi:hypothetical protein